MKFHRSFICLITVLFVSSFYLESSYLNLHRIAQGTEDTWTTKQPMPTGRHDLAAVVVNDKIYAIGGESGLGKHATNEEYTPVSDSWNSGLTPMANARCRHAAAVVNGKIYVLGGHNGTHYLSSVEEYNPATDSWNSSKAPMPTARNGLAATAVNGKIYAIGGWNGVQPLNTVEEYNPITDTWQSKTSMGTSRAFLAAGAVNGIIYVIGGYNGDTLATVEAYDPATDSWSSKNSLPAPRENLGVTAVSGRVYAIGGFYGNKGWNTTYEYNPSTNFWITRADMPTKRVGLATAAVSGKVYAIGGSSGSSLVEEYTPPSTINPAPTLSNIQVSKCSDTSAVIEWETDVDTIEDWVEYGLTTAYGMEEDATHGTTHMATLTNLEFGATYHYRVYSRSDGGLTVSSDYTFPTPPKVTIVSPLSTNYAINNVSVYATNETRVHTAWWRFWNESWSANQTLNWDAEEERWEAEGLIWLNGSYQVQAFFNNSAGYQSSATRWFWVNVFPSVTITCPLNTTYATNVISVHATNDTPVHTARWRFWNGSWSDNQTLMWNDAEGRWEAEGITWLNGSYQIQVFINDSLGNEASAVRFFRVDTTLPVTLISPENTTYTISTIPLYVMDLPILQGYQTFGGPYYDPGGYAVIQTLDGGYALAGRQYTGNFWLVKTYPNGNEEWARTYGGSSTDDAQAILQTADGGFVIAGSTSSYGAGSFDFWLVKTDADGYLEWTQSYGGSDDEYAWSMFETTDGGFVLTGQTYSFGNGGADVWVVKTDATGHHQWNQTYGTASSDYARSIIQTKDGGYALAGFTNSYGSGDFDFWLIKTDTSGNMVWNRTYGDSNNEMAYSLIETVDGGYALAGYIEPSGPPYEDAWVVKTDDSGNMEWDQIYTGPEMDEIYSIIQTVEGGYALFGRTRSWAATYDAWLIKTNVMGEIEWTQTYGGIEDDGAYAGIQNTDGGFVFAGYTNSYGAGNRDGWLVIDNTKAYTIGWRFWNGSWSENQTLTWDETDIRWEVEDLTWNDGSYQVQVFVNDSVGYVAYAEQGFSVDTTPPTVTIISPDNTTYTMTKIPLYATNTTESVHTAWWRYWNGSWGANQTLTWNDTSTQWEVPGLIWLEGSYLVQVFFNDSFGNEAFSTQGFSIDLTAPATITDLAVGNPTQSSLTLTWTAPGDDGMTGNATSYEVRYATFQPITDTPLTAGAIQWSQTYGGSESDEAYAVIQTIDGGYALTGRTESFGAGSSDIWLVKTNASGEVQWQQTYGGDERDRANAIIQTADGGYALAGSTWSYGAGWEDFWLVKMDANGVMEWAQTYGGTHYDYAQAVLQTSDGGFILFGTTESFGAGSHEFWLVKTDANGVMEWNQTYGGSSSEFAYGMVETADGGYALAGYTYSYGVGSRDAWLVKTDASGIPQWNQTYGGPDLDQVHALIQTTDLEFVLAGFTESYGAGEFDFWLLKTDSDGVIQWNQTYGDVEYEEADTLIQTTDGGYALGGYTITPGSDSLDGWLVKTDANGIVEWNQTYGGFKENRIEAILQTPDDNISFVGFTSYTGAGSKDFWLVRLGPSTNSRWDLAKSFPQSWTPQSVGHTETHVISGLSSSTQYWFAIKTYDEGSNSAAISNSPSGITATPPPPPPDNDDDGDDDGGGGGGGGGDDGDKKTKPKAAAPVDTDGDGLTDQEEVTIYFTNPIESDTDADGLSDHAEVITYGTNSTSADTDGDGLSDGAEVTLYYTDPTIPDSEVDTDEDGLPNITEVDIYGTNPQQADSDGDGLTDHEELDEHHCDPMIADTDGDGLMDGEEVKIYGCDPLKEDTDGDELSDHAEVIQYSTNPLLTDTDGDGLSDAREIHEYGTNPNELDTDGDGVSDAVEVEAGTNPLDPKDPQVAVISVPEFPIQIWVLIGVALFGVKKKRRS